MGGRGAASGLNRVGVRKLKKANKALRLNIKKHREYIKNPKIKYGKRWDGFLDDRKNNELRHWRSEINAFKKNILKNNKRIKEFENED